MVKKNGFYDFYIGITDHIQKETGKIDIAEFELQGINIQKDTTWGEYMG